MAEVDPFLCAAKYLVIFMLATLFKRGCKSACYTDQTATRMHATATCTFLRRMATFGMVSMHNLKQYWQHYLFLREIRDHIQTCSRGCLPAQLLVPTRISPAAYKYSFVPTNQHYMG